MTGRRRRWLRRALLGGAGMAVGAAVVVLVEVQLARVGEQLPVVDLDLDGPVGGEAGAGAAGGSGGLRMTWLGDSTAAGVGVGDADAALPRRVAAGLGRPVDLSVLAVSGATVADLVAEQAPRVAALRPELVLVSVGANDTTHLTPASGFRRRYERLLASLPQAADVVLLGVPDMGSITRFAQPLRAIAGWRGERLDREVAAVARRAGAAYVDIAGATGPAFRRDPGRYFAADRFHPSEAGYALWAEAVLEVLEQG